MAARPWSRSAAVLAAAPIAGLLLHAALFGAWIVDDAGISFAYARNLASGHGLVAQPGAAPVEGFSNPLWVLCCAGLEALGTLDPVVAPKLLSLALVAAALALAARAFAPSLGRATTLAGLALLAMQPAFAIWVASGLENGLMAALALAAALAALRAFAAERPPPVPLLVGSGIAGLCALCRPDGLLWAILVPAVAVARGLRGRALVRVLLLHAAVLVPLLAGMVGFRLAYFGDFVPNTFHAKGGGTAGKALVAAGGLALVVIATATARRRLAGRAPNLEALAWLVLLAALLWLPRSDRLAAAFGGRVGLGLGAVLLLGIARRPGPLDPARQVLLAATAVGVLIAQALPRDWMGEWRFATACFPFACLNLAAFVPEALRGLGRRTASVLVVAALAVVAIDAAGRTLRFRADPTVPLAVVRAQAQEPIERLRAAVGPGLASVWTPDLGAMLLWSTLRVHDLAALCDRELALALRRGPAEARDVVLGRGADLIVIHGSFADGLRLGDDPRFARDWWPLEDRTPEGVAAGRIDGVFLRRALVPDGPGAEALRRAWRGDEER